MRPSSVLAVVAILLSSCSAIFPQQQLVSPGPVAPFEFARFSVEAGGEELVAEQFEGTLGEAPIVLHRLDGRTLVGMVPELPPGEHVLQVRGGDVSATARVTVLAAPVISDPAATVDTTQADLVQLLDGLLATAGDHADTAASARLLREGADAEFARIRAAGPEELRRMAAFIAANPEIFGGEAQIPTRGAAMAPGSWFTYPICNGVAAENALVCIKVVVLLRVGVMLGTAMVLAPAAIPGALLAGLAVGAQLLSMNYWLINELSTGLVQTQNIILKTLASGGSRGQAISRAVDGELYVQNGSTTRFEMTSQYRSLGPQDASTTESVLKELVNGLLDLQRAWQLTRAVVKERLQPAQAITLEALSPVLQTRSVPGEYVSVEVVKIPNPSESGVDVEVADDALELTPIIHGWTCPSLEPREAEVEVEVHYAHEGVSSSSTPLSLTVACLPPNLEGSWIQYCVGEWSTDTQAGFDFYADGTVVNTYWCSIEKGTGEYWCPSTFEPVQGQWNTCACMGDHFTIDLRAGSNGGLYAPHSDNPEVLVWSDCTLTREP